MGNCCSDVGKHKYSVGGSENGAAITRDSADAEAAGCAALVTGAAAYTSWVELRASCNNLKQMDTFSKSDPMAVLYSLDAYGAETEIGRTEVIPDEHDPVFITSFKVCYNFEKLSNMRILVVDIDDGQVPAKVNPCTCDFLGELDFKLSEVVAAKGKTITRPLNTKCSHQSTVTLRAEEMSAARELLTFTLAASGLRNVELLSKSDPFLEISKQQGDGVTWLPVYKTEVRDNNLNPTWDTISMKATVLNNGDPYRPILLKVFDWEASGKHRLLGQLQTNAQKLREMAGTSSSLSFAMPDNSKLDCGKLLVKDFKVTIQPTFLDYIQGGVELSFLVAVDFTASNGQITDPKSLHYLYPGDTTGRFKTPYEEALTGVGQVLEFYDTDRNFPAFGFGGQRGNAPTSHCFPLNDQPDAVCVGVEGIKHAYRHALSTYKLSGPTLFAPIVNMASAIAAQQTSRLQYHVLLILTDGVIMDMEDTINAIITASYLPMSILIVGIGSENFDNMEKLDSDDKLLSLNGRTAERDIVQFVEFSKFRNNGDALAAELLAELPGQFLAYVRQRNIPPPPAGPM